MKAKNQSLDLVALVVTGQRLKAARENAAPAGLTREQVRRATKIATSTLQEWEAGLREIPMSRAAELGELYGVSPFSFFTDFPVSRGTLRGVSSVKARAIAAQLRQLSDELERAAREP